MLSLNSVRNVVDYFKLSSDDWVDRAHYIVTTGVLIFFATLVASGQTFGSPLQCMIAANFPSGWSTYVNSYCYVTGTFVTDSFAYGEMPDRMLTDSERIDVSYYQWIPYVFVVQAVFFLIPHFFWVVSQMLSDVDFSFVIEQCLKARDQKDADDTKKALEKIAGDISKTLQYRKVKGCREDGLGKIGVYVYCLMKLMNVLHVVLQLLFLSYFIGHNRTDWGLKLLHNFWTIADPTPLAQNISQSDIFFPRISFCYFRYNALGTVKDGTVQCLLMLNMLNEKLFAMIYAWLYVLLVVTVANLVYMLMNVVSSVGIFRSRAYLQMYNVSKYTSMKFASEVLGLDGLLLLHFVKRSSGFSTASDLAHLLYEQQFTNNDSGKSYIPENLASLSPSMLNGCHDRMCLIKKVIADGST